MKERLEEEESKEGEEKGRSIEKKGIRRRRRLKTRRAGKQGVKMEIRE